MKSIQIILLASCLVLSAFADVDEEWAKHQKTYPRKMARNSNEAQKRRAIFVKNYEKVQKHNAENESQKLKLNVFGDWTEEEFHALRATKQPTPAFNGTGPAPTRTRSSGPLPASYDLRAQGLVTPVQFQQDCGVCWAFASVAAIESLYLIKYKGSAKLSEQNLQDCVDMTYGRQPTCKAGGTPSWAMQYVRNNQGLSGRDAYPWVNSNEQCKGIQGTRYGAITGAGQVNYLDEQAMMRTLVEIGPMAVGVNARYFPWGYTGWVMNEPRCGTDPITHSVTIVGYGTDQFGVDFWLFKNSWDKSWGDQGYGRMQRGVNMCNIASYAVYPYIN